MQGYDQCELLSNAGDVERLHLEARKDHERIVSGLARTHLSELDDMQAPRDSHAHASLPAFHLRVAHIDPWQAGGLRCHPFGKRCTRTFLRFDAEGSDDDEAAAPAQDATKHDSSNDKAV